MPKKFNSELERRTYERVKKQNQKTQDRSAPATTHFVYKITCKQDAAFCYIGITNNIEKRLATHKNLAKSIGNNALYDYIYLKGGFANFSFEIIHMQPNCKKREIQLYESFFIRLHKPRLNAVFPYILDEEYNAIALNLSLPCLPPTPVFNFVYKKQCIPLFKINTPTNSDDLYCWYYIYKIFCSGESTTYIGMTRDVVGRFETHKKNAEKGGSLLYDTLQKWGSKTCFEVIFSEYTSKKSAMEYEAFFIKKEKATLNAIYPYLKPETIGDIQRRLNLSQ
jgi:predicted GIY-YIG superfamily endonuclease